jgi:hypothetical protein
MGEMTNENKILVGKREEKRILGISGRKWEDNIKMILGKQWEVVENERWGFIEGWKFTEWLCDYQLLKKGYVS